MREYLAEIYRIASYQEEDYVSTSELADRMGKTAPAVVRMASRLLDDHLIEHERYQGIRLTPKGTSEALISIRKHRIIEVFLVKVMKYGWEDVHDDADSLGAAVSDDLLNRMNDMAGNPKRCPHGEPIPTADGVMPIIKDDALNTLEPTQPLTVSRVNTHDIEKLRYLRDIGLTPGQDIELLWRAPFNGPLRLRIGRDEQVIGVELAGALRVCPRGEFQN